MSSHTWYPTGLIDTPMQKAASRLAGEHGLGLTVDGSLTLSEDQINNLRGLKEGVRVEAMLRYEDRKLVVPCGQIIPVYTFMQQLTDAAASTVGVLRYAKWGPLYELDEAEARFAGFRSRNQMVGELAEDPDRGNQWLTPETHVTFYKIDKVGPPTETLGILLSKEDRPPFEIDATVDNDF